jgi:hypothetical protein
VTNRAYVSWLVLIVALTVTGLVSAATDFNQIAGNTPMYTKADVDAAFQPLDSDLTALAALSTTAHGVGLLDDAAPADSRTSLGLGGAAILNVGSGAGTVCAGDDSRLSDARTPTTHAHAGADITSGTLDGDRLPAISTTKRGGVPATGTPAGLFLKDDGTWAATSGGSLTDGDKGDITVSGSGAAWAVDSGAVAESEIAFTDITTNNVTTSAHGFVPKAPNTTTTFLRGDATWATPSFPGRLHKVTSLTTGTTTFTPDSNTTMMVVEAWGAGGGGGGADGGSSQSGVGAGGGGGGYQIVYVTTMRSGYTTSIPNGAAGGTAGNNAGSTASDTTFIDTSGAGANLSITAKGGAGGGSMAAGTGVARATPGAGGALSTATGGDVGWSQSFRGGYGGAGLRWSAAICFSGDGGAAPRHGGGEAKSVNGSTVGESSNWGGDGGSGGSANSTTDRAGGSGSAGLVVVWEYR